MPFCLPEYVNTVNESQQMQTMANTPFLKSMKIQARVIGALLMREIITRYGRYNIGFMWLILEPMIFTLGVTLLWNVYHHGHIQGGISITAFAYTGYSTVMLWRNAAARCSKAIEPNTGLLHHRNVRVIDLFFSRVILEIAGGTVSTFIIGVGFTSTGLIDLPKDIVTMMMAWFLLILYTFCIGLVIGTLSERWDAFDRIYHPAMYFYLGISGAFFMVNWLPNSLKKLAVWVPTVSVTEMLRHGYFGDAVTTYEAPGYLCVVCLVLFLTGLLLAREAGYRVEPQ